MWVKTKSFPDPFSDFLRLQQNLLGHVARAPSVPQAGFTPLVDLSEEAHAYVIDVEVPGVRSEDLDLELEGDVLTIQGQRHAIPAEPGTKSRRQERMFGSFQRSFRLPEAVEFEKVEATLEHGLLHVRVPKRTTEKSRKIVVRAA